MRKILVAAASLAALCAAQRLDACTNIVVTPGASSDGSSMVSYAADAHWLFGDLRFRPAARFAAGSRLDIIEWDTNIPLGNIAQVERTYHTVGNQNQYQLTIAETTWGGRPELMDPAGTMDYGSIIYVTLQRARTAREAIRTIVDLANEYGYHSEGETFSIADGQEAWIMDLIGKGESDKGIVWVARRIPDGYISAHANQARIRTFPLDDPETLYAPDVISFAREKGYFSGSDEEFSFREAYCPLDFGTVRGCDARVWSAFNILCDGKFTYEKEGEEVTADSYDWINYAMGYDLAGELPLWVKPESKITVKDVADAMRDHFEGTPMDMTQDIGAGGNALPYRWRPMDFEWEGKMYCNERAIATQQTGFWFVAQSRGNLPDEIGALQWFGCDDAATSYLTPIYTNTLKVPECLREGNGNILEYSPTSQFWICNRVANACYKMYNQMAPYVKKEIDAFENDQIFNLIPQTDSLLLGIYNGRGKHPGRKCAIRKVVRKLTDYSVSTAQTQFCNWVKLEETLLVKFIDGNVKAQNPDGSFMGAGKLQIVPGSLIQPGYTDKWKEAVVKDHGSVIEER